MNSYHVDRSGRVIPSLRLPLLLLAAFLGLTMWIAMSPPTAAADSDVAATLAQMRRACEDKGGQFESTWLVNEDGSLESVQTACSISGSRATLCIIWEDGDFVCVKPQQEQTIQEQVSIAVTPGAVAAPVENSQASGPTQSGTGSGTKVTERTGAPAEPSATPAAARERK